MDYKRLLSKQRWILFCVRIMYWESKLMILHVFPVSHSAKQVVRFCISLSQRLRLGCLKAAALPVFGYPSCISSSWRADAGGLAGWGRRGMTLTRPDLKRKIPADWGWDLEPWRNVSSVLQRQERSRLQRDGSQVWLRRPGLSCSSMISPPWAGYRGRKLNIKSLQGLGHDDTRVPVMCRDKKALFGKNYAVISPWGCKNQVKMKIIHFSEEKITHLGKYLTKLTCPLGIYSNHSGQSKHLLQAWRRERDSRRSEASYRENQSQCLLQSSPREDRRVCIFK